MGDRAVKRGETVILAAGDFPRRGGEAWRLLVGARRVVCCDSAGDACRRRLKKEPTVVTGDGDSVRGRFAAFVRDSDQDTNDLEKAIAYCAKRGWKRPVIVGATGKREDHTIGNVFRALAAGLEIVTDRGRFVPVNGRAVLRVRKGAAVSVFAPDPRTRMTSTGLQWPLAGVTFDTLYRATLNRATASRICLTSTHPVYAFIGFAS